MRVYFAGRNETVKYTHMEKQISLGANENVFGKCAEAVRRICRCAGMPQRMLRNYYSKVLGENVGEARARAMTEAQAAFFAVTLPVDYPLALRFVVCAWFVVALRKLRIKS